MIEECVSRLRPSKVARTLCLLAVGCSSVYHPTRAGYVTERCGSPPMSPDAIGYHAQQDDWNVCAKHADDEAGELAAERHAESTRQAERNAQSPTSEQQDSATKGEELERRISEARASWVQDLTALREQVSQYFSEDETRAWEQAQTAEFQEAETQYRLALAQDPNSTTPFVPPTPSLPSEVQRRQAQEAAATQAELERSIQPVVGTFDFVRGDYQAHEDCEFWSAQRLSLTIGADGSASWNGFRNGDGICQMSQTVASNCGASGSGRVALVDGSLMVITDERGAYGGGGTPSVVEIWQCGRLRIKAPYGWSPAQRGQCVRLGSEPDATLERVSEALCQTAPPFEELNEDGVQLIPVKGGVELKLGKRDIRLKRTGANL